MANFEELYNKLGILTKGANTSCKEFTSVLEDLGFQIVHCRSGGHKIAKHPAIHLTECPTYNCGHNQGATVGRGYVKRLHKFVKQYEESIKEYIK
jgi:predicted RNA binding protein YcfA (HicA-like mRNA interferase family)